MRPPRSRPCSGLSRATPIVAVGVALGVALAACGNRAPAQVTAGGHKTIEGAVTAFHRAVESGDPRLVEAQFPTVALLDRHLTCGARLRAEARGDAERLLTLQDAHAVRDTEATLVGLPESTTTEMPVGVFEPGCDVTTPLAIARVRARWDLDGARRETRLTLARLDGLWYAFDVPGL